ncbi:hypothetical protein Tco_0664768 [Tanacetum coccineum]
MFVLLGCSRTSPVFDPNEDLCDTGSGLHLCRGLYSCEGVTAGIGLEPNGPISSCCVYQPIIDFASGFGLDLPKLQCSSYASIYGFGGDETDPMKWDFGLLVLSGPFLAYVAVVEILRRIAMAEVMLGMEHGNTKFKPR